MVDQILAWVELIGRTMGPTGILFNLNQTMPIMNGLEMEWSPRMPSGFPPKNQNPPQNCIPPRVARHAPTGRA